MKILIIEDDLRMASFISRGLREEHYTVEVGKDGEEGLSMARSRDYDLIVLDLMLPKKSGLEVLKELRADRLKTAVIILTAKDKSSDKIAGLDTGADDYLVKPFAFEEFLARIRALLRRKADLVPQILKLADLEMDTLRHRVTRQEQRIDLTRREYELLEYFLRHQDRVVTRTLLSEHVWDHDFDSFSNVIDVVVARLRKKIDGSYEPKLLNTVRGIGYRLGLPEQS